MNTQDANLIQFALRFLKCNLDDETVEDMPCPIHHETTDEIEDRIDKLHDQIRQRTGETGG